MIVFEIIGIIVIVYLIIVGAKEVFKKFKRG